MASRARGPVAMGTPRRRRARPPRGPDLPPRSRAARAPLVYSGKRQRSKSSSHRSTLSPPAGSRPRSPGARRTVRLPKRNGHLTAFAGKHQPALTAASGAQRRVPRAAWGRGAMHPESMLYLPPGKTHPPPRETQEFSSGVALTLHPSELGDPKTSHPWSSAPHRGLRDPHAQHSHGPKERFPAWTAKRGTRATCSLAHLDCRTYQSPFSFSYPLVPPKAPTCSTLSVRQRKDSSEPLAQERPPKCAGDELLAPVTPTPKPCQGSEPPPQNGTSPHQPAEPPPLPSRAGKSGAPALHNLLSHSNPHARPAAPSLLAP